MKKVLLPLLLVAFAPSARATVIASANFTGMAVTNQTSVNPVAGANDFTWSLISAVSTDFDVVADDGSPGIGAGNALRIDQTGTTGFRGMIGTMGSSTSLAIGETLTLSFSGRYYENPANNSGGLRFGLINPNSLDNNFFIQIGTGGNTGMALFRDGAGDNSPGSGGGTTNLTATSSGPAYASLATDPFEGVFSITRAAASDYTIVASVNGSTRTATSSTGWDEFNAIFIRNGSISADFLVDNITVSLIPEPSAVLLGALGLLALPRRRRA
jgi:hypothetical protein